MSPREQLTYREIKVTTLVWQGRTKPEIALDLGTSEQVIKNQLRSVFDRLGVWSGSSWPFTWLLTAVPAGRRMISKPGTTLPPRRLRKRLPPLHGNQIRARFG